MRGRGAVGNVEFLMPAIGCLNGALPGLQANDYIYPKSNSETSTCMRITSR